MKIRFVWGLYIFSLLALFAYSYTQVDLSLTLSRLSVWQYIEKSFQYIGYFQRPLSTGIYIGILVLLFACSLWLLRLSWKKELAPKTIWIMIVVTGIILAFSYNAFSYDLFNYIFDAKLITHYHVNPYLYKALDFPHDPMLSFMHWTQRTYPYGPIWLGVTVPLSFIGFQFFMPTFYLFKLLMAGSYIGTAYFIHKIMQKVDEEHSLPALIFFTCSPLVLIEGLVSAHNDMVMIFLATMGIYFLIENKYVRAFFLLGLSIATKFATVFILPLFMGVLYGHMKKQKINWPFLFVLFSLCMIVPVVAASLRTNFQPWYVLYAMPFAALAVRNYYIAIPYTIFSLFALLEYVPFLYKGDWNDPVPQILTYTTYAGIIFSLLCIFLWRGKKLLVAKKLHSAIQ